MPQQTHKPKPQHKPNQPQRYLRMDLNMNAGGQGLHHVLHILWLFLGIASSLNRTPIINNSLQLSPAHNGGTVPDDCDPRSYRNLDSARRHGQGLPPDGAPLQYVMRSDIPAARFTDKDVLRIEMDQHKRFSTTQQHQHYPLVILDLIPYGEIPYSISADKMTDGRQHFISWQRSPQTLRMADEVAQAMAQIPAASPVKRRYSETNYGSVEGDYCCIHSRRGDRLTQAWTWLYPYTPAATDPKRILRLMKSIPELNMNSAVYLMTDEQDPAYTNAFKALYPNLRTFRDFPQLRNLREGNSPNNYLLYDVERLIFERAAVRISTRPRHSNLHIVETHRIIRIPPLILAVQVRARRVKFRIARTIRRSRHRLVLRTRAKRIIFRHHRNPRSTK